MTQNRMIMMHAQYQLFDRQTLSWFNYIFPWSSFHFQMCFWDLMEIRKRKTHRNTEISSKRMIKSFYFIGKSLLSRLIDVSFICLPFQMCALHTLSNWIWMHQSTTKDAIDNSDMCFIMASDDFQSDIQIHCIRFKEISDIYSKREIFQYIASFYYNIFAILSCCLCSVMCEEYLFTVYTNTSKHSCKLFMNCHCVVCVWYIFIQWKCMWWNVKVY